MDDMDNGEDFAGGDSAERIIRITGDISEETAEKFSLNLHRVAETPGEIHVIIASDGGDIESGLRIIDAINIAKHRGCTVHTCVSGKAYSMSAYLSLVGDRRTIYPHARLMFHSGRYDGTEESDDFTVSVLQSMVSEMSMYNDTFRKLLAAVGLPNEMIEKIMLTDVYMNAEEAISLGVMHSIETELI
jgi:ATP-dependent protease ClpP protease subunit